MDSLNTTSNNINYYFIIHIFGYVLVNMYNIKKRNKIQ